MKYSIGDRVIVKKSGERGIVVGIGECPEIYAVAVIQKYISDNKIRWYSVSALKTDLTAIEKPFGLLSKDVQGELKAVNNGENIQYYERAISDWKNTSSPFWEKYHTFRLDPNWKQEEVKEMTVGEIEAKLGHKVKIIKGE